MATNVHLTPDLEQFARSCVDSGRFNNVSEVVRSALRLLQNTEERRSAFMAMLADVHAESERDGYVTIDEAAAEMDRIIDEAGR